MGTRILSHYKSMPYVDNFPPYNRFCIQISRKVGFEAKFGHLRADNIKQMI